MIKSDDILVITTKRLRQLERINTKEEQPKLKEIRKKISGKDFRILPVSATVFAAAVKDFKAGKKSGKDKPDIDVGRKEPASLASAFFDELRGKN